MVDMRKIRRLIDFVTVRFFGITISDKMLTEAIKDFVQMEKESDDER